MSGSLWVDPHGVVRLGDKYTQQAGQYDEYLTQLEQLRADYGGSWGDDEIGRKFGQKFEQSITELENMIRATQEKLEYTGTGLQLNGKRYAQTDEENADYAHQLLSGQGQDEAGAQFELQFRKSVPPDNGLDQGFPALSSPVSSPAKAISTLAETPAHMTSSSYMKPAFGCATIDGQAIPQGFRLMAFNALPDGRAWFDVNLYESLTPVTGREIRDAEGKPIDDSGDLLFLVAPNPDADPKDPGYHSLVIGMGPDGAIVRP